MKHFASPDFWECFESLPESVKELALKSYEILKENPHHPSLHFKKTANYRSVRVGRQYRALGIDVQDGILWFWIGTHADYDKLLS
ncbi:MAG: hypothetical protein NT096_09300 [Proteobacteria bacterium]|nr:hypothetical protein [Pseudomonadota bacterium]